MPATLVTTEFAPTKNPPEELIVPTTEIPTPLVIVVPVAVTKLVPL